MKNPYDIEIRGVRPGRAPIVCPCFAVRNHDVVDKNDVLAEERIREYSELAQPTSRTCRCCSTCITDNMLIGASTQNFFRDPDEASVLQLTMTKKEVSQE